MSRRVAAAAFLAALGVAAMAVATAAGESPDPKRDILVTFVNQETSAIGAGISEPYRKRKRYAMDSNVRRHAADIAGEYGLVEVDRWPIDSLSVFCFVFRTPAGEAREPLIARLRVDPRIESAQALQRFETLAGGVADYDDTHVALQRALEVMGIPAAHRYSRGQGVRVAIVDSRADTQHEDLEGRITELRFIDDADTAGSAQHGTAVASVIGANANNAAGIVGVAPESAMELYVACWADGEPLHAVCNSFTLAKALDAVVDSTPHILNLSLTGPPDPLLARLLEQAGRAGVIIVAAQARRDSGFPASLEWVIGVGSGDALAAAEPGHPADRLAQPVYAPGREIMVAIPDNAYDFRSGSSLSAAHVSGVIALLLSASPGTPREAVQTYLRLSQRSSAAEASVDACLALQMLDRSRSCPERAMQAFRTRP